MSGYFVGFILLAIAIFAIYREYPVRIEGTMYLPVFEYDETHPDVEDEVTYMMENQSTPENTSIPGTFWVKRYRIDSIVRLDYATVYHLSSGAQIVSEDDMVASDYTNVHTEDLSVLLGVRETDLIAKVRKGEKVAGQHWGQHAVYTDTGQISSFDIPTSKLEQLKADHVKA